MKNSGKITLGAFLLMVLFLTYLEASEPDPVNWSPSYLQYDKIPLGTFVFYESWKEKSENIENVDIPPFEFIESAQDGTYFFLNNNLSFDKAELSKLLKWIEKGNTLFVSANSFNKELLDTLNLKTTVLIPRTDLSFQPYLNFVHPDLQRPEPYKYEYDTDLAYFSKIDTMAQTVLGVGSLETFSKPSQAFPVFLKAPFGKGNIFIHSFPQAFSNYFMLSSTNYDYAQDILGYLGSDDKIYWDQYYKNGKVFYSSPLYILLRNKALKWSYYLALLGIVAFIIFEGKRKQRPVPVKEPLKNLTLEYSKTIADLFLEQKRFKDLAIKKIEHFNDYIRQRFRIDTSVKNDRFFRELSEKTNKTEEESKELFRAFNRISEKSEISKNELQEINQMIDSYKPSTK
jgi:hypothetical protein